MEEVIKVSNLTRKYKDFSLGPVDLSFPKGFATALSVQTAQEEQHLWI